MAVVVMVEEYEFHIEFHYVLFIISLALYPVENSCIQHTCVHIQELKITRLEACLRSFPHISPLCPHADSVGTAISNMEINSKLGGRTAHLINDD